MYRDFSKNLKYEWTIKSNLWKIQINSIKNNGELNWYLRDL